MWRDLRFAARALGRAPLLCAAAILTLGVGLGLATGVWAVAYGVLLRPLPYPAPDRLVLVTLSRPGFEGRDNGIPITEFEEWQARLRSFDRLAATSTADFTVRGSGEPRVVRGTMITDGFFETIGISAAEGNTSQIARGSMTAAISARLERQLGRGAWRERGLTIGASDFGIAAVMPPSFAFPADDVDLWVRADAVPGITLFGSTDQRPFRVVGRLAPGVSLAQARDDVSRVLADIDRVATPKLKAREAAIVPLQDRLREDARPTVVPFIAGAVLVLLIACANVSGLLVGRSVAREREFAVRRAIGGGAVEVLRASLSEAVIIALAGWALGLWIAHLVVRVFESAAAGAIHNLEAVRIDTPVILVSLALALAVALLSGAAPALRALRSDPSGALKQTSERTGRGGRAVRGALVAAQIALTVVLLVAAGLLMRTVVRLVSGERGFEPRNGLAMRLMLTQTIRFEATDRAPFVNRLVTDVRHLPGVVAAGVGSDLPPRPTQISMTIRIVSENRDEMFNLGYAAATPGFLEALGATLVRGRLFEERDRAASPPPAVITETAARMMFRDREALDHEWPAPLPGPAGKREKPRVIGIVRDIKFGGLDRAAPATLFAPWEKLAPGNAQLVVRTAGRPEALAPALRRVVQQIDPSLPLATPQTLDEVINGSIADRRLRLQLAAVFAALALALASIALWGAVAQNVLDRRRELAVRVAMGATSGAAVRLMLRGGLALIVPGIVAGAAGAALASRALRHLLHGVSAADPATFAAAGLLALGVSMLACYLPARRAARVSPAELLRDN